MGKFLESLAKIGLVEVTGPAPEQQVETVQATNVVQPQVVHRAQSSTSDPAKNAEIDAAARNMLIKAMQNDGAPLVEDVADTLETLQDVIADERARYISALKLVIKRGSSVSAVLSDFDKCLGVLEENKRKFEADSKSQLDTKVGSRVRTVEGLNSQIDQKNAQIEALKQEIAQLSVQRDKEQGGIQVEQDKINLVQERFVTIYNMIRSDIETKRTKVAQHGEGL